DERVERAREIVVAVAQRDGLVTDAGEAALDGVVAVPGRDRDRARRRGEDVVVAGLPADGGRGVAITLVTDGAERADGVVAEAAVDRDRHLAGAADDQVIVSSTAQYLHRVELGARDLGIDRAVGPDVD